MSRRIGILVVVACLIFPEAAAGQSAVLSFTEQEARSIAEQSAVAAKGDKKKFDKTFQELVRKKARDYSHGGYTLRAAVGLGLRIYSRMAYFQEESWQQVRILKPVSDAIWPSHEVIVTLTSGLMTAPLVNRIVLKRDDLIIEPTESAIVEGDAKNLQGAVFKAREGWVGFPLDVFQRQKGVKLSLVLIPVSATENISARIDSFALNQIHMSRK